MIYRIIGSNSKRFQPVAAAKRRPADAGHAIRDRYAGQPGAAAKRRPADAGHAVPDRHVSQPGAAVKRRIADAGHAVPDDDRWNLFSAPRRSCNIVICSAAPCDIIVIHFPCAADGQQPLAVQRPGQVLAADAAFHDIRAEDGRRAHGQQQNNRQQRCKPSFHSRSVTFFHGDSSVFRIPS